MKLQYKILGFATLGGAAMAAGIETRERFDITHPIIFYTIHSILVIGWVAALLVAVHRGQLTGMDAARGCAALIFLYAIAATRSSFGPAAIAIIGITTIAVWVLMRQHGP